MGGLLNCHAPLFRQPPYLRLEQSQDFLDDEELQLVTCLLSMVACGMRRYWKRCKDAFDAFMARRNTLFHLFFVELFAMAFFGHLGLVYSNPRQ